MRGQLAVLVNNHDRIRIGRHVHVLSFLHTRCPRQIVYSLTISRPFSSLVSPASLVAQRQIPPAQPQSVQAVALPSGWPLAELTSPVFSLTRFSREVRLVSDHHFHIAD